jgi:phosphoenolpyruvate carboxylase
MIEKELIDPEEILNIINEEYEATSSEAEDVEHIIQCHTDSRDEYLRRFAKIIVKINNLAHSKFKYPEDW